jgi:diguanylate cyclase (GGDEF)-like protein
MFGYSRARLLESDMASLGVRSEPETQRSEHPTSEDPQPEVTQHLRNALGGRRVTFEWNVSNSRGRAFPVEIRLFQMPARDLRLVRVEVTDISDRIRAERALIEKTLLLESTFENIDEGICLIDAHLNVLTFNRRLLTLLGIDDESFKPGVPVENFIRHLAERGDYGPGDVHEQVQQRLDDIATFRAHEFRRARPNGRIIETRGRPMPGGGVVRTYRDVTATHVLAEQLSRQARFDALTGLLNRWEFERRLRQVLEAGPSKTGHVLCYLDLDQFKIINDTCGHDAGDELLRQLGEALPRRVRTHDSLARLGGDEFGILIENCSLDQAHAVADEVRQAIEDFQFAWNETVFRIGVSIGVVEISEHFHEVGEVLKAADAACYAAKDRGRNRVQIYREDDADIARRHGEMQWVARLDKALAEDRFQLYAQPIMNLAADARESALRSCSFEVLLRLVNEERQLVPPGAFLPAAERFGLSARLDRWVVGSTMRWLAELGERIDAIGFCSINLSGQSLGDDELMASIQNGLARVPAEKVCFEITETAAMRNFANARNFIETLREQGCHFALDDFGSGLSSFGYLKSLPVDIVKIDGNFVKDIVDDEVDRAFVRSINEVGHIMGKKTIAEFVENDALVRELIDIDVDYGQGYGLGRPVPIDEIMPT